MRIIRPFNQSSQKHFETANYQKNKVSAFCSKILEVSYIKTLSPFSSTGLVSFGIHSDLGRVVQAIKRELEKNPPFFPAQYQNNLEAVQRGGGGPPNHHSNLVNGVSPPFLQQHQQQQQTAVYSICPQLGRSSNLPISESSFPQLSKLSLDELKELDENPTALKIFVRSLVSTEPSGSEIESKEVQLISMVDAKLSEIRQQIDALISERRRLAEQVNQIMYVTSHLCIDVLHAFLLFCYFSSFTKITEKIVPGVRQI
jgi:hypothetical protein